MKTVMSDECRVMSEDYAGEQYAAVRGRSANIIRDDFSNWKGGEESIRENGEGVGRGEIYFMTFFFGALVAICAAWHWMWNGSKGVKFQNK